MKTTKIVTSAIILSTLGLAAAPAVHAADHTESYTSVGKIGFEENTDVTNPVDPTNPDKPVDPLEPTVPPVLPGTPGPLSIDYVSNFDFGKNKISGDDTTYYAAPVKAISGTKYANYLQVTDKRGTNAGWKLSVKQEKQFNDGATDLDGAVLKMGSQKLNSKNMDAATHATDPAIANATITATPGSAVEVLNADKGHGMGTWTDSFGEYTDGTAADTSMKAVSLSVPGNSVKEAKPYTTDLTWTITDAGM